MILVRYYGLIGQENDVAQMPVLAALFIRQALETVGQPTAKKREPPGADLGRVV